jgi:hypothetical protein
MLERELNAALWGNDFRWIAKFRIRDDVKYKIGPIAHDRYRGIDETPSGRGLGFVQYSYFRNAKLFYQIQIEEITQTNWLTFVDLVEDIPLRAARFHRGSGTC